MRKSLFPLNAHVVSWPTSIKNLVITLKRTFLSLSSSFCHFIVPHPSVIFQAHVGKAFPFPSSEDATEATATEARGCKVESSSSSLQAAAASPTQGRHYMLLSGKRDIVAASGSITSMPTLPMCSIPHNPGKTMVLLVLLLVAALSYPAVLSQHNS